MNLNSGDDDFAPADPATVLVQAGLDPRSAIVALDALRAHGCLRETKADWPAKPAGAITSSDVRLTGWLPAVSDLPVLGDAGRYGLAVPDGTTIAELAGLLVIATDDVLAQRRSLPDV